MTEPSVRTSRLAIAGTLLAVLAVAGLGFFAGRTTAPQPPPPPPVLVETPPPPPPEPRRALDRAEIIRLGQQAAAAFVSGEAMPESVAAAGGRRFDLIIPFGCSGQSDFAALRPMRWQYDAEQQTLRASIIPTTWPQSYWEAAPLRPDGQSDAAALATGFWIPRPWSTSGDCPTRSDIPRPSGAEPITLSGQTLAIAQFFSADGGRGGWRSDRPFEVAQRIAADRVQDVQWLRLRVTGRIDGSRRGGPVHCVQPGGIDQRPICVVAARMEDIQIEIPGTGEVLGTWSVDR